MRCTNNYHMRQPMTTLLIDADILAYHVSAANQHTYKFGDDAVAVDVGDIETAFELADKKISELIHKLKAKDVIICLSCKTRDGFRRKILPTYKSNRTNVERPTQLQAVKDYLARVYTSKLWEGLEADDVMGILSTEPHKGKRIIVSEDKDMQTIEGWLYNPRNDTAAKYISMDHAHRFHMLQTLMGDAVDGYKGCKGIGKIKANRLLDNTPQKNWWRMVVNTYEAVGMTEGDALVQARVARILRHVDRGTYPLWQPILWSPDESK